MEDNCKKCPETTKLVESIPRRMGDVFFSALRGNSSIKIHTGPINIKVTAHLPLIVPKNRDKNCRMQVGNETREFKEGEWLIFSDSFPHRVWNDTNETRFVLIIDTWNPGLSDVEVECMEYLMAHYLRSEPQSSWIKSMVNKWL